MYEYLSFDHIAVLRWLICYYGLCCSAFSQNCYCLLVQVGEDILVTAMHVSGQWEGELKNGAKGLFPFTHIQFIDDGGSQD